MKLNPSLVIKISCPIVFIIKNWIPRSPPIILSYTIYITRMTHCSTRMETLENPNNILLIENNRLIQSF